jgi:hypothetical protein
MRLRLGWFQGKSRELASTYSPLARVGDMLLPSTRYRDDDRRSISVLGRPI